MLKKTAELVKRGIPKFKLFGPLVQGVGGLSRCWTKEEGTLEQRGGCRCCHVRRLTIALMKTDQRLSNKKKINSNKQRWGIYLFTCSLVSQIRYYLPLPPTPTPTPKSDAYQAQQRHQRKRDWSKGCSLFTNPSRFFDMNWETLKVEVQVKLIQHDLSQS